MGADIRPQYNEYPFILRTAYRLRDHYRDNIAEIDREIARKTEDIAGLRRQRAESERVLAGWERYIKTEKGAD
jgi:hypothetical protein